MSSSNNNNDIKNGSMSINLDGEDQSRDDPSCYGHTSPGMVAASTEKRSFMDRQDGATKVNWSNDESRGPCSSPSSRTTAKRTGTMLAETPAGKKGLSDDGVKRMRNPKGASPTSTSTALHFAASAAVILRPQAPYVDRPGLGVMVSTNPVWATVAPGALSEFYSQPKFETNDISMA
ncbi:hypothetical protein LTR17_014956 [Elasticomyces elasticus]|nr:hypothetical protein LTR17_014956 [Elasticomyces elasticus]